MTDPAATLIVILADRTGSMGWPADGKAGKTKAELTTKGIKDLIADQAAQRGTALFSLCQFDSYTRHGVELVTWFAPGSDPRHDAWAIEPRGGTPLLDATAHLIRQAGAHLDGMAEHERPGRVIFVIGTDGEENCSCEFTRQQVAGMIAHQRDKYGWEFLFIGADIDSFAEAGGMNIAQGQVLNSSGPAMAAAYASTSDAISRGRSSGQSVSYSDAERQRASGTP
jgi:hypothetical protein